MGEGDGRPATAARRAVDRVDAGEEPSPEVVEAVRRDPDALREALRRTDDPELVAALRGRTPSPEMVRAVRRQRFTELHRELGAFVAFVGYSRSGGSVVAALMDAHPSMVVAHQVDLFAKDERGDVTDQPAFVDREAAVDRLLARAAVAAERGRPGQRLRADGTAYYSSYAVDGGWQGRHDVLRAIGTKNAVESALVAERFGVEPLRAFEAEMGVPLRFVHVVRDPRDNIATMRREHGERTIVRWRRRADGVVAVKAGGFEVLDVHLDDLIADPRRELRAICDLCGVEADDEYLDGCAAVVADQPSRTAESVSWTAGELRAINEIVETYPWLHRYRTSTPWSRRFARLRRPRLRRPARPSPTS